MSGSETGVNVMTTTREQLFNAGSVPSQPSTNNMRLAFTVDGTTMYKPINTSTSPTYQPAAATSDGSAAPTPPSLNMNTGSEQMRPRKRGRPRKYGPDGTMNMGIVPSPSPPPPPQRPSANANQSGGGGGVMIVSPTAAGTPSSPNSMKKARGRPPGSGKKHQLEALGSAGSAGFGFTPHVINVKAGEDISSKIMSFSQNGPRAVCVLSAIGTISNVTLRQAATSGGTVTYEGRFEILSLSGSFLLSENSGQRSRTGGLSVSLSGPDGRVLGGCVAGLLTAASPVQIVVGSFFADGGKESKSYSNQLESASALPMLAASGVSGGPSSPPSRGTLSESSGGPGSPLNQSTGACNNNYPPGMSNMPWK
ncbi:hypothetical protein EZV62_021037 [Acer yangbiense]|uniref:AT-hook motif nuclear-localized protein n=1 Tax=Acer yangbiense TaxID=1000413 RepID=A0A5C7H4E6_9ROSI|nr:hypothetical protein EZV62_021037 [Acer yangbiense]